VVLPKTVENKLYIKLTMFLSFVLIPAGDVHQSEEPVLRDQSQPPSQSAILAVSFPSNKMWAVLTSQCMMGGLIFYWRYVKPLADPKAACAR
jgi:hypothetical protein